MPTLWDILTKKDKPAPPVEEDKVYNPLHLMIGGEKPSIVTINRVGGGLIPADFSPQDIRFSVKTIRAFSRPNYSPFVDYDLIGRNAKGEVVEVTLRLVPLDNPDGKTTHTVLLIQLFDEFAWNEDFHSMLTNTEKPTPDDPDLQDLDGSVWWRVGNFKTPWEAGVVSLEDVDHSGKVDVSEATRSVLTYWDFYRNNDQRKTVEFFFAEMDENHFFQIRKGEDIDPLRIDVV